MYTYNSKSWIYLVLGLLALVGVVVFVSMGLMVSADESQMMREDLSVVEVKTADNLPIPQNIDAVLLKFSESNPDELITVIVQKQSNDNVAEALVETLGGTIVNDLPIIKSFTAELTGRAIIELASSPAVKHISPDAPIDASLTGN